MKILVVGAGSIGRRHLANLAALGPGEVAVCDPDATALSAAGTDTRRFSRLAEALAWGPDAVMVCTPTHRHCDVALAALEAGAHAFVEKPLAASLDGTIELIDVARARGKIILVGCNMRFHPAVQALKRALAAETSRPFYLGSRFSHYLPNWRPGADYRRLYSARRAEGGGVLLEGVHEVDYLGWLAGDVTGVAAHTRRVSDLEIDGEDYAWLFLEFESGAVGHVHLDYLSPLKLRGCEVALPGRVLRWTSEGKSPERIRVRANEGASGREDDLYGSDTWDANEMYVEELKHFLDCIAGRRSPLLGAVQARRVLALLLAARDAADERKEVPR